MVLGVDAGVRRPEPFQIALSGLRDRLHDGTYPPGARIRAVEVADALRLSATPVREALSRLAGEGVLEERRGQGFFVRALNALDIADLYRRSLAYLLIAQDPHRRRVPYRGTADGGAIRPGPEDPVQAVERLFADWVAEGGSRMLVRTHRSLQIQLGPVRRVEALALRDLAVEAVELEQAAATDGGGGRLHRLRRFHARRIRLAGQLTALLEGGAAPEDMEDRVG